LAESGQSAYGRNRPIADISKDDILTARWGIMREVTKLAQQFCELLRAGRFLEAGERFWASDIKSVDPPPLPDGTPAIVEGFAGVKEKTKRWFERCAMDDLEIEGPFINGDTFLVVLTFVVRVRATGETRPIREFAVFVVESGKIAEERHFY